MSLPDTDTAEHDFLQREAITAYDSDSGMTMLRIGSMNLMLHGIERPRFHYTDTLSKSFNEEKRYARLSLELEDPGPEGHNEIEVDTPGSDFRRNV